MHVAQFVHRFPPAIGGAEAYTARLCNYLLQAGDDVTVWTSTAIALEQLWSRGRIPVTAPELPNPGLTIHRYSPLYFPARRYLLKSISLLPARLVQCLTSPCNPVCPRMWRDAGRDCGPLDAVHATAFPYSFPIACGLRLARRRRVPFYITPFLHLGDLDNPNDRTRRQYTAPHLRWLLKEADGVFVQTRAERSEAIDLGVPEERVHLQGLGIDPEECTRGDRDRARKRWGIQTNETVFGHLSNNSTEKGTVALLQAAERAWSACEEFRVVLAGPEMPSFTSYWRQFGPKSRVVRLGQLSEAHKRDFYAAIDAFVLPSRCDSFGLVLLEAWANGRPNIVYRAGGPGELVCDGVDGLLARCDDVDQLASHLARLAQDGGFRRSLGEAGRQRIGREFRWSDKLGLFRNVVLRGAGPNPTGKRDRGNSAATHPRTPF